MDFEPWVWSAVSLGGMLIALVALAATWHQAQVARRWARLAQRAQRSAESAEFWTKRMTDPLLLHAEDEVAAVAERHSHR
jgi:hypothetical protein